MNRLWQTSGHASGGYHDLRSQHGALRFHRKLASAGLLLLCFCFHAYAAERIALKNGFDLFCDHRESNGDRVRLYLDSGNTNFIDVDTSEIVGIEHVDLPGPGPSPQANPAGPTSEDMHQILARAGKQHDLDVDLLASIIHAESGGNLHAVSRAGARGLMQLMPKTAAALGVSDSFAADQNINGGTAYLDALLKKYHDDLALALAAYNAGPAAVDHWHGIPPYRETRLYVARIIHEFNRRYAERMSAGKQTASLTNSATKNTF